jgi:hypothetical protein
MRDRGIDQRLVGEIQIGRPIRDQASRQRIPLLVGHAENRITISGREHFARNVDKMLLVFRPASARRQFEIVRDVVIGLAERRVGIEHIGVLAYEIVVPLIVEAADRIGIDVSALQGLPATEGVLMRLRQAKGIG